MAPARGAQKNLGPRKPPCLLGLRPPDPPDDRDCGPCPCRIPSTVIPVVKVFFPFLILVAAAQAAAPDAGLASARALATNRTRPSTPAWMECSMLSDPDLARLARQFPSSEFFRGTLLRLRRHPEQKLDKLVVWTMDQPSWPAAVALYLSDQALILDAGELALEGAISMAQDRAEAPEEEQALIPWCTRELDEVLGLCLWREQERAALFFADAPHTSTLDRALGTAARSGRELIAAFNDLPDLLRLPLYRLALKGQSLAAFAKEAGWPEALVEERIERAMTALHRVHAFILPENEVQA